jgi:hypothetical protein
MEQKQQRRLAEERKRDEQRKAARKRNLITGGIALLVIVAVVALVISERQAETGPIGAALDAAGCGDVEEFEQVSREHIEEGAEHEPYNSSPPTSGPHYGAAAQADFYEVPQEPERLVHNLEHGQIVVWYQPDLPEDELADLEDIVSDGAPFVLASPYEGAEAPIVFSAWQNLQECELPSSAALDEFRREFQGQGPEKLTPPFDG